MRKMREEATCLPVAPTHNTSPSPHPSSGSGFFGLSTFDSAEFLGRSEKPGEISLGSDESFAYDAEDVENGVARALADSLSQAG